jgi:rhodanese-related sulfurtransferase
MTTPYPSTMPALRTAVPLPISAASAKRRQLAGAALVDVRSQIARHLGSIAGAVVIEPARLAESPFPTVEPDRSRDIIVFGNSAEQALPAAEWLTGHGYGHVYYLVGGYAAWRSRHGAP